MSNNFSAYILAGGKSSRMGVDKGLCSLKNKPLISYIIAELQRLTDDITIITTNNEYNIFNLEIISDDFENSGPAAGIAKALKNTKQNNAFICSCDMPFIISDDIINLYNHHKSHEITLIKNKKYIEPMFSFFSKSCKEKWLQLLMNNTLKLSDYFSHFDTNFVNAENFLLKNPLLFFNINKQTDLKLAEKWMKK